jgi:small GTP-binding protein
MLWDLAGSEEFDAVRASYLRGAVAALIVCDLTQPASLAMAPQYADQIRAVNPKASFILVANKLDLTDRRAVSDEDARSMARILDAPWLLTSARTGQGVDEAFRDLGRLAIGC